MKKLVSILKHKDVMNRLFFTIMIIFVIRIGAAITVPGVTPTGDLNDALNSASAIMLMDLLGGGALQNFSIFALGVSPYITAQIIISLLSKDVLPALSELSKQGQYGRKKQEMATRYLTVMLAAVQGYGIIITMENSDFIQINLDLTFWTYAYIVIILIAGAMLVMWLGDQITTKGIGNGISIVIFSGAVRNLPIQISSAWTKWITNNQGHGTNELLLGSFQFLLYILVFLAIIAFVVYIELAKRKIPVQHSGKGGRNPTMAKASFLPIKVNSAGVIPVIFASSIMMAPSVIASFISSDYVNADWLNIFNYGAMYQMTPDFAFPWGLIIYLTLTVMFTFFYASLQINPAQLAENFQKNGSYIPGIRPGNETERYVKKVLNRVTCIGALSLAFIAGLPVILTLTGLFGQDTTLVMGGTSLIIIVGVALEVNNQINGLLAGKSFGEVQAGSAYRKRGY